jgi:hypothetical protein
MIEMKITEDGIAQIFTFNSCKDVDLPDMKPYCLSVKNLLFFISFMTFSLIIVIITLQTTDVKLTGLLLPAKHFCDVVYMDYIQAFDTVPHMRFMNKLKAYGVEDPVLSWISSFLSERVQQVAIICPFLH